jgi:hypothetical protein
MSMLNRLDISYLIANIGSDEQLNVKKVAGSDLWHVESATQSMAAKVAEAAARRKLEFFSQEQRELLHSLAFRTRLGWNDDDLISEAFLFGRDGFVDYSDSELIEDCFCHCTHREVNGSGEAQALIGLLSIPAVVAFASANTGIDIKLELLNHVICHLRQAFGESAAVA